MEEAYERKLFKYADLVDQWLINAKHFFQIGEDRQSAKRADREGVLL